MDLTDIQEQLSVAALHATCARAGFAFETTGRIEDKWGIDANRRSVSCRSRLT